MLLQTFRRLNQPHDEKIIFSQTMNIRNVSKLGQKLFHLLHQY